MAIGTAAGFSNLGTVAALDRPRLRLRLSASPACPCSGRASALSAVIPIALASDTLGIATMEVVDNLDRPHHPRRAATPASASLLFWGSLALLPGRRRRLRGAGQPPPDRPRQGPRGRPRDRRPRRPAGPRSSAPPPAIAFAFGAAVLLAEADRLMGRAQQPSPGLHSTTRRRSSGACGGSRDRSAASRGWSRRRRYCIDVVTQITAIEAALDKVALGPARGPRPALRDRRRAGPPGGAHDRADGRGHGSLLGHG